MTREKLAIEIKEEARKLLAYFQEREKEVRHPITMESGKAEFENISKKLEELGYTLRGIEYWYDNIPLFAFEQYSGKFIKEIGIRGNKGKIQMVTRIGGY